MSDWSTMNTDTLTNTRFLVFVIYVRDSGITNAVDRPFAAKSEYLCIY